MLRPTTIVLTGAPSTGKSSSMAALKDLFKEEVLLLPESAVVLLSGGFPAPQHHDLEQIRAFQQAVLNVQRGLEFIMPQQNAKPRAHVFDRASLDGGGFWPLGPQDFLKSFGIDQKAEYQKFDHVLFLELPNPNEFGGLSHLRFHDYQQSLQSETQLRQIWQDHPRFQTIKATETLDEKIQTVCLFVKNLLGKNP